MDTYQIWCDLKAGEDAQTFVLDLRRYLSKLEEESRIQGYRLLRRKLGLAPDGFTEFQIIIDVENLAQLERAFQRVAAREPGLELLHSAVNQRVSGVRFALYRDFPDVLSEP